MRTVLTIILSILLLSCAHIAPFGQSSIYRSALADHTRSEKIYHDFETRLIVNATYRSIPFLKSYMDEYGNKYKLDKKEKEARLREEMEGADRAHQFLVSLYTTVRDKKKPGEKDSPWRFYMSDMSGRRVSPSAIKRIEGDDILSYFYPYLDDWSSIYLVDFSKGDIESEDDKVLSLIVTGPYGEVKLDWK